MDRGERETVDKAIGIALERAALHAVISSPLQYVDDYGPAPERTDPNRKIWTQAVSTRAQYEAMHGTWDPRHTPHPTSGGHLSIHHRIAREAWIDSRTFLELEAMLSGEGRPEQIRELTTALTRRVDQVIDTKASYIIKLLGERQTGTILGPLWDQRARAIEPPADKQSRSRSLRR